MNLSAKLMLFSIISIFLVSHINSLYFDLNDHTERCYIDEYFHGNVFYLLKLIIIFRLL